MEVEEKERLEKELAKAYSKETKLLRTLNQDSDNSSILENTFIKSKEDIKQLDQELDKIKEEITGVRKKLQKLPK